MTASALHSRRAELGDEEVGQRTYLRWARASRGCYEVQAAFGQAPVGQIGSSCLPGKILRRDEFREFGYRKARETVGNNASTLVPRKAPVIPLKPFDGSERSLMVANSELGLHRRADISRCRSDGRP